MDTQRLETIEAKTQRAIIPTVRIVAGLLWLANLHWKRPPDFGQPQKNGLFKFVQAGIDKPVFTPFSWVLEHVVLKQYHLFGWIAFLIEAVLAAGLLVGWKVRWLALLGVGQSAFIGLSVIHLKGEWPWSYYLMIALHLLLFASAAGKIAGLDGLTDDTRHRAWTAAGGVGAVIGLIAVLRTAGEPASAKVGQLIGWRGLELEFMKLNLIGAIATLVLGALLVVAGLRRDARLALLAGAGFAVLTLQVLVQWRLTTKVAETGGLLGGDGGTMGFWLALTLAALVPAIADRRGASATTTTTTATPTTAANAGSA